MISPRFSSRPSMRNGKNLQLQFSFYKTGRQTACLWLVIISVPVRLSLMSLPTPSLSHLRLTITPNVVRVPSLTQRDPCPLLPCSAVITTAKYSSAIRVRKKKSRSARVSSPPSGTSIKLWFIPIQTEYKNQGSCFRARFFIFLQRRRGAGVAAGWQIKWSNGSRLGRAAQTAARQAEWAVECLSSCRVHSTQWKATHLVTGLLGRGVPALTLLSCCNRATKTEGVRNALLASWKETAVKGGGSVWFQV